MIRLRPALLLLALLGGCAPISPERAAEVCEARARAAQGPTGRVTVGTNSRSGRFFEGEIGVTSDFIAGRDPVAVYRSCVYNRTGQAPIRSPVLR